MRKPIIVSTAVATLALSPVLALAAPPLDAAQRPAAQEPAAPAQASQAASPWIAITSARDIVGREIRDPQGKQAGVIRSLVVDLRRGRVLYALVGSGGTLVIGDGRVAVPFSALHLSQDDDLMRTTLGADQIAAAPRISEDQLADLAQPGRVTAIYAHYAIPVPQGYVVPPSSERAVQPDRYVFVQHHELHSAAPGGKLVSAIHGETVKKPGGETLGEIDHLMIDVDAGRVAYVLVAHGGFLGIGEEWMPVPPQALAWSEADGAYVMRSTAALPRHAAQDLRTGDVPAEVRRDQLQALYQGYGVTPYWQQG